MPQSFIRVELKYCERCGGLWLRPAGSNHPCCPTCAAQLADTPRMLRRPLRRSPAPPTSASRKFQASGASPAAVAGLLASSLLTLIAAPAFTAVAQGAVL